MVVETIDENIETAETSTQNLVDEKPHSLIVEKNKRILVIDDNEAIHKDFKTVLKADTPGGINVTKEENAIFGLDEEASQQQSFQVDSAFQGEEGLKKVKQALNENQPYAMAFVDIRMPPGWDGIETIQRLWEVDPSLQIAICTAYSDYSWEDVIEKLGETDQLLILKKPFDNIEVRQIACSLTEKWHLINNLEKLVEQRTSELTDVVEKLEQSNADLKDFVYIASHDLREPLRKISSFGMLLENSLEGKLEKDDKENLDFMIDGAKRMNAMIEGLLVYSRLSRNEVPFETVDLNQTVEQLKQFELAQLLEDTNAKIEIPQPLPSVQANEVQIRQLLQNLIANAIKYRLPETTPRIVIRAKQTDENQIRIEVQDNGIGIEQKYCDEVFKMFRRLHTKQEYEGTGIGLAVCRKIIDRHKGRIGVESKLGEGSTFWFTLQSENQMAQVN